MSKIGMDCDKCKERKKYSLDFDAYFCPRCNQWKEKKCDDPDCMMCKSRPDKPKNNEEK